MMRRLMLPSLWRRREVNAWDMRWANYFQSSPVVYSKWKMGSLGDTVKIGARTALTTFIHWWVEGAKGRPEISSGDHIQR
jgi:hypothetical protein